MKRTRQHDVTAELVVGAFVFLVLLMLGLFTIVIGKQNLFQKTYEMSVYFEDVRGLKDGEAVLLRGMKVGIVDDLVIDSERNLVEVRLLLKEPITLYSDYSVEVVSASMLGGKNVIINQGKNTTDLADTTQLKGRPPADLVEEATRVVQEVRESLNQGGVRENLEKIMANLRSTTDQIASGSGTIGRLLNDDEIYTDLRAAFTNFNAVAVNIRSVSERLERGEGTLGKLFSSDETIYDDIKKVAENLNTMAANLASASQRIEDGEGTLGKLLSKNSEVYDDLKAASASIRSLAAKVDTGDGSLSRLINDPALYDEAKKLVEEVRATVDDFRETSPITTFSTILFGAF